MPRRTQTTTVVLTLIGVVLAGIAVSTDWPGWVIVVVFLAAAVVAHVVGRDDRSEG